MEVQFEVPKTHTFIKSSHDYEEHMQIYVVIVLFKVYISTCIRTERERKRFTCSVAMCEILAAN